MPEAFIARNALPASVERAREYGADWFDLKIELRYGSQTAALKDTRQTW